MNYLRDLGTKGEALMDLIAQSLRSSGVLCSFDQEQLIAASAKGTNACFQQIFDVASSPPQSSSEWHIRVVASLRCLKSILAQLVSSIRVKLGSDDPVWPHVAQLISQINGILDESEDLLRSEAMETVQSDPPSPLMQLQHRLVTARRTVIPFRPTNTEGIETQLETSFNSFLSFVKLEMQLQRTKS